MKAFTQTQLETENKSLPQTNGFRKLDESELAGIEGGSFFSFLKKVGRLLACTFGNDEVKMRLGC